MPRQLITSSLEQAERAAPPVMAAALVYSARVLAVFDPDQAVRVLERGISVAQQLPSGEREALLFSAVTLAAIVSPAHALRLLPEWAGVPFGSPLPQAMANMLSHGRVADVAEYLQHPMPDQEYPFHAVGEAIPGEISVPIIDPTVAIDGVKVWDSGRFTPLDKAPFRALMAAYSGGARAFEQNAAIGL